MSRIPREKSEANIYHTLNRGVGRCIIFEDDEDRRKLLQLLADVVASYGAKLHAWCLMDNHYHLLIEVAYSVLPKMMHALDTRYAAYFNARHKRDGRLFGGPYRSEPIGSDEHFLTVLRYIHQNPIKAGIALTCEYPWSSYCEYIGRPHLICSDLALSLLSGVKGFCAFHAVDDSVCKCMDVERGAEKCLFSDQEALALAREVLTWCAVENVAGLSRDRRNEALRTLKNARLPIRQISRLTGIPKSTVSRA